MDPLFSRRAFLASAAAALSPAAWSGDDLKLPVRPPAGHLALVKDIAKESGLTFEEQVRPQNHTGLIVHFGIAHSDPRASGIDHLVRPEIACTLPYMLTSELLQETLGIKSAKAFERGFVGAICEGENSGAVKRSTFDPKEEFKKDCLDDARDFLGSYGKMPETGRRAMIANVTGASKHYEKLAAEQGRFRSEELLSFGQLAKLYTDLAIALNRPEVQALADLEERIQRALFAGREALFAKKMPLFGAELPPKEHLQEAKLMLALYSGGEALVGPAMAVGIQSGRNGRYVREAAALLRHGTVDAPTVLLVYLGCGEIHDLTTSVERHNHASVKKLALCRLDLPPLVEHNKKLR